MKKSFVKTYCDIGRKFYGPNFKSDFNMDLLRSVNYICHIFLVKSKIAKKAL